VAQHLDVFADLVQVGFEIVQVVKIVPGVGALVVEYADAVDFEQLVPDVLQVSELFQGVVARLVVGLKVEGD